jgi:hypothetical protein
MIHNNDFAVEQAKDAFRCRHGGLKHIKFLGIWRKGLKKRWIYAKKAR